MKWKGALCGIALAVALVVGASSATAKPADDYMWDNPDAVSPPS